MKYNVKIESLPETEYLVIKGYMTWSEITEARREDWERKYGFPDKHLTDLLKRVSGATEVYKLFCNSCRKDAQFDWVCSDDIACENLNNSQAGEEFGIVRLAASEYLKIDYHYGNEMTLEQAAKEIDDYFWNEWIKCNPYISKIEEEYSNMPETADITFYDEKNHRIIEWHPIKQYSEF